MAFKKRPDAESDVCVAKFPLRHEPWQRDYLDQLFWDCNQCKNALVRKEQNKWKQLSETKHWRYVQAKIADCYKKAEKAENEATAQKQSKKSKTVNPELQKWLRERNAILKANGLTQFAFQKEMSIIYKHFGIIHTHIAQKVSDSVWDAFADVLYGQGEDVSFSKIDDFRSIRAKQNGCGITYADGYLYLGGKTRYTLKVPLCFNDNDKYGYDEQILQRNIHYCGIERRPYPDGWHYFAVLCVGGKPPQKVNKDTGELLHSIGKGRVGHDIGTQTIASVGDGHACLAVLAEQSQNIENQLRVINRAMDRSRRAMNPEHFKEDGTVVPVNQLPPECIRVIRGKARHLWHDSKRYKELKRLRLALYARQAESRIMQHNALANILLGYGDDHYIETMMFKQLAEKKKAKQNDKGKNLSRKRFGKSIANRSPATFVQILKQKVKAQGGTFSKIDTYAAKASQYNHQDRCFTKKKLSQRWEMMPDGNKIQRDLYSAFCIQNTNSHLNGFERSLLEAKYEHFLVLHRQALEEAARHSYIPSSMGIRQPA